MTFRHMGALRSVVLLLSLGALYLSAHADATIDFRGDWETGDSSQWEGVEWGGTFDGSPRLQDSLQIGTSPVAEGRYAAKFVVNPGDKYGGSSGERTLARWIGSNENEGDDFYYAWSTLLPSDWVTPSGWAIPMEWHADSRFLLAPIRFNITGDQMNVDMTTGGCSTSCAYHKSHRVLSTLSRGKWQDFILRVNWHRSEGTLQLWHRVEGQPSFSLALELRNVPTLPYRVGDPTPPTIYLLQGLYRGDGNDLKSVLYHDGMRRGTSYEEVAGDFASGSPSAPLSVTSSIATGSSLSGTISWTATTSGATASSVTFSVDGSIVGVDTAAPFEMPLDTAKLPNGSHTFRVDATSTNGVTANASAVATVTNVVSDPLSVTQNLTDGRTLEGVISWAASVFDGEVSKVEFSVDGQVVASDGLAPYATSYDTTRVADGAHAFAVKAYATDGTTATARANVNVANADRAEPAFSITQNASDGLRVSGAYKWVAWPVGKTMSRVTFWIDGKKVANENHAPYEQAVDTRRYADGIHEFRATALAADGSDVSVAANVMVANAALAPSPPQPRPAPPPPPSSPDLTVSQNVVSGQTLSGSVSWTASPGGQTASKIEFWVDGNMAWTENLSPYVYGGDGRTLNTRELGNGSHSLEVRAYGSGSTARTTATVNVSNTSPELASSIRDGQTITALVSWTIEPNGFSVSSMEFFIDGKPMWTERLTPWVYGGDGRSLDTRTLSKGSHILEVRALGTDGVVRTLVLRVTVS